MTPNQLVLLFAFFGISIHTIVGQLGVIQPYPSNTISTGTVQIQEESDTVNVDAEEDEEGDEEEDALSRVNNVETVEEFMSLLQINGHPVTSEDIYDDMVDEDGKQVISGGGRLAVPDNCQPRNTTVRITMEGAGSDVAFFPRCTRVERCGGCCPSPHLECRPSYTERLSLKVLKGRVPFPGATHLLYTGFAPVIVERHMRCHVMCTLTPEKCGPLKRFQRQQCRCKCRNYIPCIPPKTWNPETCACECSRSTLRCCYPNCNANNFDSNSCDCVDNSNPHNDGRVHISIEGSSRNASTTQEAAETNDSSQNIPSTPAPSTTMSTTTTTTSTTTTSTDPCATRRCPPNFTKVVRNGQCVCRHPPSGSRGRHRGRGRG